MPAGVGFDTEIVPEVRAALGALWDWMDPNNNNPLIGQNTVPCLPETGPSDLLVWASVSLSHKNRIGDCGHLGDLKCSSSLCLSFQLI